MGATKGASMPHRLLFGMDQEPSTSVLACLFAGMKGNSGNLIFPRGPGSGLCGCNGGSVSLSDVGAHARG